MAKGVQHFTASGKPYNGPTHVMADGTVHTGNTHTSASVRVFHKSELNKNTKPKKAGKSKKPMIKATYE